MSRRFAAVGVGIEPARLQAIAAGMPIGDRELTDVKFAVAAAEIERERRLAKLARNRRRCVRWAIVVGLVLVLLNLLVCMAYALFSLAEHASPLGGGFAG